ncbi:hypothetical protein ACFL7M_05250 [Thermodesulfobacteriota bacterium]
MKMPKSKNEYTLQKMGIGQSLAIFSIASFFLILETQFLIPALSSAIGVEIVVSWFIVAGLGIFTPLLIVSVFILKREGILFKPGFLTNRLRFNPMDTGDWLWSFGAIMQNIFSRISHCNIILYASPGKEGFYQKHSFRKMKTGMAHFNKGVAMKERGFTE